MKGYRNVLETFNFALNESAGRNDVGDDELPGYPRTIKNRQQCRKSIERAW